MRDHQLWGQRLSNWRKETFRSLLWYNYRIWASGAFVSNLGTWMQRIAQDWLVLTQLTQHSATSVGVVMSLQFGPPIVLMPLVGRVVDQMERRKLLFVTQAGLGLTALGLGFLVLSEQVQLSQVYLFAALMGCISAFDAPLRQTFTAELVGDEDLPNAVALNSTLFNAAQLLGPAAAGVVIAAIGTGWLFILNALSFAAVLVALQRMRTGELRRLPKARTADAGMGAGLRYVWSRTDFKITLTMLFVLGTYGLNFPIFISTMALSIFHGGPHLYGLLTSSMALGSILGALYTAGRTAPRILLLASSALAFGLLGSIAALMPSSWWFAATLVGLGAMAQIFTTSANSLVQLRTDATMRGRVMAIYMAIFLGCTPLGAPVVGWIADAWGPRWALALGCASGFVAALIALLWRHKVSVAAAQGSCE